ncbi:MAG: hypothetical protein M3342_17035 [Bacteroidota bacterium]|nr:hypothetical protein [Bacteroidota bacterium]
MKALFTVDCKMTVQEQSASSFRFSGLRKIGSLIDLHTGLPGMPAVSGCGVIHHIALKVQKWNHFMALHYDLRQKSQIIFFNEHSNNCSAFYFWADGNTLLEIVGQRPLIRKKDFPDSKFQALFYRKGT